MHYDCANNSRMECNLIVETDYMSSVDTTKHNTTTTTCRKYRLNLQLEMSSALTTQCTALRYPK